MKAWAAPSALLAFIANAALVWAAWRASRKLGTRGVAGGAAANESQGLARWLAFVVLFASMVVITVQVAGIVTFLDRPAAVFALGVAFASVVLAWTLRGHRTPVPEEIGARGMEGIATTERRSLIVAGAAVLLAFIPLAANRVILPPVAWDALTYHLPFAVTWLQRGDLATTVPAAGDAANTYYPLAGQALLYWNLISFGGDRWTVLSQLPFLLAGGVAVAALAIRCGATPRIAVLAALASVGTPVALRQSVEVMLDVEQAALFAIAVYFTLRSRDRYGPTPLLAWLAVGLLIGLKYSGIVLALPLLAVLGAALPSTQARDCTGSRALHWAGGLVVMTGLGGYAYIRNAFSCGNPLMPLRIGMGPWTLFPGPAQVSDYFGASAPRLGWGALFASPRAILEMGFLFAPLVLLLAVAAWPRGKGTTVARERRLLASIGIVAFVLSALLLPFREHRYFLPIVAVGWASAAAFLEAWGRRAWLVMGVPLVLVAQAPVTLAYALKDMALLGVRHEHVAALCISVLVLAAAGFLWQSAANDAAPSLRRAAAPLMAVLSAVVVMAAASAGAYEGSRYQRWNWYWGTRHEWEDRAHAREDLRDMAAAWAWIAERTSSAPTVVAYAGLNTPFPLSGQGFRNHVTFVPRSGPPDGTLYRWGKPPVAAARNGDPIAWRSNLHDLGVGYLCLFRFSPLDGGTGAFPIEDEWARQEPAQFRLAWSSAFSRIYSVNAS